ncbi:MAG: FAD:protein FMN transferase [Pseudomonadales bacterium]
MSNSRQLNKRLFFGVAVLFCFIVAACGELSSQTVYLNGKTMGTTYHITLPSLTDHTQQELAIIVQQELDAVDQAMSTYKSDSIVSLYNAAQVGQVVAADEATLFVVKQALGFAEDSAGAFNPAIGPLVNLWGFGPSVLADDQIPSEYEIQQALAQSDYRAIVVHHNGLGKTAPVSLDLSAIAKGYGVDVVAEHLLELGITDFMVEVGGELRLQGNSPRGSIWRIGIESPGEAFGIPFEAILISNKAVATSGDYRNYFEADGVRYSHTIDPSSGYPIKHKLASVTVVADTSATADALATAISVMGPERGMEFSRNRALAVFMLVKSDDGFVAQYTQAFEAYLELPDANGVIQ